MKKVGREVEGLPDIYVYSYFQETVIFRLGGAAILSGAGFRSWVNQMTTTWKLLPLA